MFISFAKLSIIIKYNTKVGEIVYNINAWILEVKLFLLRIILFYKIMYILIYPYKSSSFSFSLEINVKPPYFELRKLPRSDK